MLKHTTTHWTRFKQAACRLYHCEKGAEGLEKLLIIGAIVIPLLGLLVFFRSAIGEWVGDMWEDVQSDSSNTYDTSGS